MFGKFGIPEVVVLLLVLGLLFLVGRLLWRMGSKQPK
jgi:hypothetical protein